MLAKHNAGHPEYWPRVRVRRVNLVSSRTSITVAFIAAVVPFVGGCSCRPNGLVRHDVAGMVTFDGQAVPSGTIYFEADASRGNAGPVSVVSVVDGRYDTKAAKVPGPVGGPLRVRISGYPKQESNSGIQPPLFPEHTLAVELVPSAGQNVLNFEVPQTRRR
jgi:hypothetical protein